MIFYENHRKIVEQETHKINKQKLYFMFDFLEK